MGSIRSYFKCLKWRNLIIAFSAILIGLLFILTPQTSADVICYVAGILLLASGIAAVVSYLASRRLFGSYALVSGIVLLVCGVFCLLRPEVIQGLLTVIFGVFLVIDGMVTLQDGIDCARAKLGGWWVLAALAVITIALGCVILFGKFDSIMLLAGISLIVDGVFDLIATLAFSSACARRGRSCTCIWAGPSSTRRRSTTEPGGVQKIFQPAQKKFCLLPGDILTGLHESCTITVGFLSPQSYRLNMMEEQT